MNDIIIPAICCIGYNRADSMSRLLTSVEKAVYDDNKIPLIISIDESDKSDEVESVAKNFKWTHGEKIIKRYPKRLGLKEHCLLCGDFSMMYGAALFLEDDAVVTPGYYRYTKAAVNYYKDETKVMAVSLYTQKWSQAMGCEMIPAHNGYDTFFFQRELSHGLCWIGRGWKEFRDWYKTPEGQKPSYNKDVPSGVYSWKPEKSWSYHVSFYMAEKQVYFVCPYHSYGTNLHELGEHSDGATNICQTVVSESVSDTFNFAPISDGVMYDSFFERRDNFISNIRGISFDDICFDLNNTKYDWSGYKYILTLKELPYKVVCTFGINMEPIESNIIYNVPGDDLKLYEIPSAYKAPKSIDEAYKNGYSQKRMNYLLGKYPLRSLIKCAVKRIKAKLL